MTTPQHAVICPKRATSDRARPFSNIALIVLAALVTLPQIGCGGIWNHVRERERVFAQESARTQTARGQCAAGLASLDRAQARLDLGLYSREATIARIRCYEKLGLGELAAAHRRLISDFYTSEPMALPAADGSSIFRVKSVPPGGFERPPKWLQFMAPRYSPYAQRSKLVGRVVVSFEIAGNDRPRKIRVLEMPHPLLATWAIEAVTQGEPKKKEGDPALMPGGTYVATFVFEWRWAKEVDQDHEFDS